MERFYFNKAQLNVIRHNKNNFSFTKNTTLYCKLVPLTLGKIVQDSDPSFKGFHEGLSGLDLLLNMSKQIKR